MLRFLGVALILEIKVVEKVASASSSPASLRLGERCKYDLA